MTCEIRLEKHIVDFWRRDTKIFWFIAPKRYKSSLVTRPRLRLFKQVIFHADQVRLFFFRKVRFIFRFCNTREHIHTRFRRGGKISRCIALCYCILPLLHGALVSKMCAFTSDECPVALELAPTSRLELLFVRSQTLQSVKVISQECKWIGRAKNLNNEAYCGLCASRLSHPAGYDCTFFPVYFV